MGKADNTRNGIRIGLVGDFSADVPAHQAIPLALQRAAEAAQVQVGFEWLPTPGIGSGAQLAEFDGLWCVPASPYRDMLGALTAIRFAREHRVPFLGTCGAFSTRWSSTPATNWAGQTPSMAKLRRTRQT